MRALLLLVPLLLLLGLAALAAVTGWNSVEGTEIGFHGQVALALGIGLTLLVTAILVGLLLYSHRRGYDRYGTGEDDRGEDDRP